MDIRKRIDKLHACMAQLQEEKDNLVWEETKIILLETTTDKEKKVISTLLDNQRNHLVRNKKYYSVENDIAAFDAILLPLTLRIFKDLPVTNLVGIQPMNGRPVSETYFLRYTEDERKDEEIDAVDGGKRISLNVVTARTEARTSRLQAAWTLEAAQDISTANGLDIEAEMCATLAQEIRGEITEEIVHDLNRLAKSNEEQQQSHFNHAALKDEDHIALQLRILSTYVNRACTHIGQSTRRGAGNFIVVSNEMATFFENAYDKRNEIETSMSYLPVKSDTMYSNLIKVGEFHDGRIDVYASSTQPMDEILVGYKGTNSNYDTGYVYAPYIPVMSSGVIVHPKTFQPFVSLMTRAGKQLNGYSKKQDGSDDFHANITASSYYRNFKVSSKFLVKK